MKIVLCILAFLFASAIAFDLGQYKKTYDAAKNTYELALEKVKETEPNFKAARDAYKAASMTFTNNLYDEHTKPVRPRPPIVCTEQYEPLCCKGKTVSNMCYAVREGFNPNKDCKKGECPTICPAIYQPVCCNGKTFSNECVANGAGASNCRKGPCPKPLSRCENYGCKSLEENRAQCLESGQTCSGSTFQCDDFSTFKPKPYMCCKALTESCLKCADGVSNFETYCKCNPNQQGCPIQKARQALKNVGQSYSFEFSFSCFCQNAGRKYSVVVKDGKVVAAPSKEDITRELDELKAGVSFKESAKLDMTAVKRALPALEVDYWVTPKNSELPDYWRFTLSELLDKAAEWSLGHRGQFNYGAFEGSLGKMQASMDMDPRIADEEMGFEVNNIQKM